MGQNAFAWYLGTFSKSSFPTKPKGRLVLSPFLFFLSASAVQTPVDGHNPYSRQGTVPHDLCLFFSLTPSSPKAGDSRIDDPVQRGEGREVGLTRDEFTVVFCPIVVACMLSAFYGQGQGCIGASRNTLHLIPRALTWSIRSTRFASSRPVRDT